MRNAFLRSTVCVAALVLASPALSQTAAPDQAPPAAPNPEPQNSATAPEATPTPESVGVGDIIVTAQRRSEKLKDVPLTVTSLPAAELARNGVTSVNNLSTLVSGFTVTGAGPISSPAIRGVSTTVTGAGVENPNAVYLDGVYQVNQYSLSNDIPDLDRIEVLKGPQGTLFGRNASGGAIQIFTKNPSFTPHADINLEEGAFTGSGSSRSSNHFKVSAFATVPIVDDLIAVSVAGGASRIEGYQTDDRTGHRDGEYNNRLVRGKILITPSSNFSVTAGIFYSRNESAIKYQPYKGLTADDGLPGAVIPTKPWHDAFNTDAQGAPEPAPAGTVSLTQRGGYVKAALTLEPGTLTSLTGYTDSRQRTGIASVNGAFCPDDQVLLNLFTRCLLTTGVIPQKETSQEFNFVSRDFGVFSFTTGAYYYHGRGDTVSYVPIGVPGGLTIFNSHYDTKSYAGYGEATVKPTDSLSLIAGIRYTDEKQHDFTRLTDDPTTPEHEYAYFSARNKKWTPRASIRYAVTPNLNAYFTYSVGYKSGYTGALNQGVAVKPENLKSYEAGLKYGSHSVSANIALFYYNYGNLQISSFDGVHLNIRNGDARLYGLDGDFTAALSSAFRFRGTFSWLPHAEYKNFAGIVYATPVRNPDTGGYYLSNGLPPGVGTQYSTDLSGTRLVRAPKYTASGTLSYEGDVGNGKFDASATVSYSSSFDQDLARAVRSNSYATLQAQLGYRPGDGSLRIGVFGRNLTNKVYQINAVNSSFGFLYTAGAPREVGLSLGYTF